MKIKKAKKLAKIMDFKWVAVDPNNDIYGYVDKPAVTIIMGQPEWSVQKPAHTECHLLGVYTGTKFWNRTLKEIK